MNQAFRVIILSVITLLATATQVFAATYYESKDSCEAAAYAEKAISYQPTAKHKNFGDARVAGFEKRALEGNACVLLGAQPGKRWVFLKQGTQVFTKGTDVKFLAECQNDIFELVYIKSPNTSVVAAAECQADGCGNVTKTQLITHVVKEVLVCEDRNGKRFQPIEGVCNFETAKVVVSAQVEAKGSCKDCDDYSKPTKQVGKVATAGCEGTGCTVEVVRQEKAKVCGIAIQSSLQDQTITARLQLDVDPANPGKIRITKVRSFEGVAEQVSVSPWASNLARDCNVDQATIYQNWPAVVKKFNLPADCIPKKG